MTTLVLPTSVLPWQFLRYPYRGWVSIDPNGTLYLDQDGKLSVDIIDYQDKAVKLPINDKFMNDNFGLLNEVNYDVFDDAEVDARWNKAWNDMLGSAWAYKAASVEPPEDYADWE